MIPVRPAPSPPPPCRAVWFGIWVCLESWSPAPPPPVVWCGSRFGSPWVFRNRRLHHHHHHHHRHHHDAPFLGQLPQEAGPIGTPPGDNCIFNTLMAESWLESVHCHKDRARIGCVWDDILVTVDGFGAAMWEKYAQSQGFGIFGPGRARRGASAN